MMTTTTTRTTIPPPTDSDKKPQPLWAKDDKAKREEKNWPNEPELSGQRKTNELWVLKMIGIIVPVFMITFGLIFLVSIISWSAHYIIPEKFAWLNADQLSRIQSVIFSGAIGAAVSAYAQNRILK